MKPYAEGTCDAIAGGVDLYSDRKRNVYFVAKRADSSEPRETKRLQNERKIYQNLLQSKSRSQLIIFCHGNINKDDSLLLSLEYMEQGSIEHVLRRVAPTEKQIRSWTRDVTSAISWLHSHSIIWNGCRARHVLLDKESRAKVSGFGSSRYRGTKYPEFEQSTKLSGDDVCRELRWMAPEIIENLKCQRRSDIWSLGCFVVEMITQRDPHTDCDNDFEVTRKLLKYDNPQPEHSSEGDLRGFLGLTLVKTASERARAKGLCVHKFLRHSGPAE